MVDHPALIRRRVLRLAEARIADRLRIWKSILWETMDGDCRVHELENRLGIVAGLTLGLDEVRGLLTAAASERASES